MSSANAKQPVQLEAGPWGIDSLMRYGMAVAAEIGLHVSPSKMSKVIRKAQRVDAGGMFAVSAIGYFLECRTWSGFELYVNGYADPTGATATRNIMRGAA